MDEAVERRKLFGDLWLDGELAVMFGDAAAGKSILGVQLADALARGRSIAPFGSSDLVENTVLYFDLEMSDDQFANRYIDPKTKRTYDFAPNFYRASNILHGRFPEEFDDPGQYVIYSIRKEIERTRPSLIIIDNLTHLKYAALTNNTAAASLMKTLRVIRYEYNISILAIIPGRTAGKSSEIKLSSLVNKAVADLADSVFAIGTSTYGDNIRYIKHLKSRSGPIVNDASRVNVYRIERSENMETEPEPDNIAADGSTWLSAPEFRLPNIEMEPEQVVRAVAVELAKDMITRAEARSKKIGAAGGPFVGFRHLGSSAESEHLRDHTEEIERLVFKEQIRRMTEAGVPPKTIQLILENSPVLKRAAQNKPKNTIDFLLSRDYKTYLEQGR